MNPPRRYLLAQGASKYAAYPLRCRPFDGLLALNDGVDKGCLALDEYLATTLAYQAAQRG